MLFSFSVMHLSISLKISSSKVGLTEVVMLLKWLLRSWWRSSLFETQLAWLAWRLSIWFLLFLKLWFFNFCLDMTKHLVVPSIENFSCIMKFFRERLWVDRSRIPALGYCFLAWMLREPGFIESVRLKRGFLIFMSNEEDWGALTRGWQWVDQFWI